jgi:4-hydroxybenzoate polyprenyltransferase
MPAAPSDMRPAGWVRHAPAALRPYLLLARADRPIGTWLLFLPGAWGLVLARAPWAPTCRLLALFAVGSLAMRSAGCVINDMWDRDIDRRVARTAGRPLAAGTLSLRQATVFLALLLSAALAVLLQLNRLSIALGAASLLLVILYPLAKRVTWWPQLVMGFVFGFGAPMGLAALQDRLSWTMAALWAAAIAWDLGFDTIYGFQDIEDDARIGVRSTARRFRHAPVRFVGTCYAIALAALAAAGALAGLGPWFWPALLLPALLLARQVVMLRPDDPHNALAQFRANRNVGLAVLLAILAGRL